VTDDKTKLTQDQALRMYQSNWWAGMPAREIVMFQLHEDRLCLPLSVYHDALNAALKREVYTHELAYNREGLKRELLGDERLPTMQEILEMIPADKRVVIWPDGKVDGAPE